MSDPNKDVYSRVTYLYSANLFSHKIPMIDI